MVLTANGVLDCAGDTRTVGEINMHGLVQNGTLRVAGALVADLARDLFLNVEGNLVVDAGAKLKVVDGMLYAVAADSGTMVIVR